MEGINKEEFKRTITEEIERLKPAIKAFKEQTAPVVPDNAIGRLTRMEAISSKGVSEAALRSMKVKLQGLERALKRIDDDPEFGSCAECGEIIPPKRVLLVPESSKCVRCAEEAR